MKTSAGTKMEWQPLVQVGDRLDPTEREQYLGALLAPDFCSSLENVHAATRELESLIKKRSFVAEDDC
jgi:hypothetical protein